MHVVATAGHVDHGKSTLVRALTGQDPDRLAEEQRRGLTIELGYCWTELEGVGEVAFVDVPGHERFVSMTLSGLGPVPVAMLVVAADDPWMPQSAEHLAALDALGVRSAVLVVTRADLADPGPALARAREQVEASTLSGCPEVVVSGRTGTGLPELRSALAHVLTEIPVPDPAADVRLWVDRVFNVRGAGTVVTGTLPAGTVQIGDRLNTIHGDEVRVRDLESLGRRRELVCGAARVALQVSGRRLERLGRGTALLTPGAFTDVTVLDAAVTDSGRLPDAGVLHVGSTHVPVQIRPLGERFARLRLTQPLPLRHGDRAIVRDPGSRGLWGVEVVDAAPPALTRRGAGRRRAHQLAVREPGWAAEVEVRGAVRADLLRRLGVPPTELGPDSLVAGDWLVSAEQAATWRAQLSEEVHRTAYGVTEPAAVRSLGLPDPALLAPLISAPLVRRDGRVLDSSAGPPPEVRRAMADLEGELEVPFSAPTADRLRELGLDRALLAALSRAGLVLVLADSVVLRADSEVEAVRRLSRLPQPFTAAEARVALGTSRRVVLPLLDHLDHTGRTVRLPDDRRRVRQDGLSVRRPRHAP